ncbi:hypothetical protein [Luteimonas vadosa]
MNALSASDVEGGPPQGVYRDMLDRLPTAAYACDAEGLITYYNKKAVETWGRAPRLMDPSDRFCGSYRLFGTDGAPIDHAECWMALALRNRREYLAQEILIERPNASLLPVLAYATPLFDEDARLVAGINILVSIDERKRLERLMKDADEVKNQYMATLAGELRHQLGEMRTALGSLGMPDALEGAVATLAEQVDAMERLVGELLDQPSRGSSQDV